ncbi:polyprenyl synthetase family protein [Kribbella sp. CA-253562]|uniref:polyprenyl synthetase family protein n=1 Tax=Kribbella sp. CA-253562 TaxID=3239942 RepID=UPI003D8D8A9C
MSNSLAVLRSAAGLRQSRTRTAGITASRTATDLLDSTAAMVDPALHAAVDSLPGSTRRIAGYHFGWWDADERPSGHRPGTALRPALTLVTAHAIGGSEATAAAIPAAVAVELVHNFSMLHDDATHHDAGRRRRASSSTVFGKTSSVLAGDALLTLAFDVLAGTSGSHAAVIRRRLTTAIQASIEGQAQDLSFEQRTDVAPAECPHLHGLKTAELFACACAVGALSAGGTFSDTERYHRYGDQLGLAVQFTDDILGIWGHPAVTGKPAYADLAVRKKSAPVVAALASGTPEAAELADLYRRPQLTPPELARAAALAEAAGGREWSRQQAAACLAAALRELLPGRFDNKLRSLAQLAARGHQ